jgi:CRISPR-associated endonuclease/helicase Cas3
MGNGTNDGLIARPGQPLHEHLANVSSLSTNSSSCLGLPIAGELIGYLHDIGKASSFFQRYIRSASGLLDLEAEEHIDSSGLKGKIDHSTAGAQLVWRAAIQSQPKMQDMLFAQMLALCICSHHSGLIDCLGPAGDRTFGQRISKQEDVTYYQEAFAEFGLGASSRQVLLSKAIREMRQRLAITIRPEPSRRCDKCGLREQNACRIPNPLTWFSLGLMTRMLFSCLIDADRTDSADSERPANVYLRSTARPDWSKLVRFLEDKISSFSGSSRIDYIRQDVSEHCRRRATDARGLFTLTVPTGGGKTLSGLRFALHHAAKHSMDRIINVIPYTSIIDQNARIARGILEQGAPFGSVVLEHHSNLEPEKETPRTRLAAECWDAPVIYTTMVQFLESLFHGGTRSVRRMHRLANSVILFDEIQTLPVECVHLFCNAVNFLIRECSSTVVLCTATQPLLDRVDINLGALTLGPEREIAPSGERLFQGLKRVDIQDRTQPGGWGVKEIADLAVSELQRTGSCLVVVNTKEWARRLYEELALRCIVGRYHLSTDMCPAHRLCVLEEMHARLGKEPVLCVSTQLIEAGVDISFGSVVRFLAGLDSIVQAAGRCNRNGESPLGIVHVVNPASENLGNLRAIKIGRDVSARMIGECEGSLLDPSAMERYFTFAFFQRSHEMAYPVNPDGAGRHDTLFDMLSCNPRNPGDMPFQLSLRQSFAAAGELFRVIDAPTQGVIVPYRTGKQLIADLCAVFDPRLQSPLLRRTQRYAVNLFPHALKQLQESGAVHETQKGSGVLYLDDRYYSEDFGLSQRMVENFQTLIC